MPKFKTLLQLFDYFKTEEICRSTLEQQRWNGTPECPHCGYTKIYRTARGFKCANPDCYKKFSVTVGTVMENTKISLRLWFAGIYLITSSKKGISSHQLARMLGTSQHTGWFLLHRIREMLKDQSTEQLRNIVEVDETFVGGKRKNKHKAERDRLAKVGTGYVEMAPVVAMLERKGRLRLVTVPGSRVNGEILKPIIRQHVEKSSLLITDGFGGYYGLNKEYWHEQLEHNKDEFVRGSFHTNSVEGFFGILKRGIIGIYHYVSPEHLHRYCNEFAYRYNTRDLTDYDRFMESLKLVGSARLRYNDMITKLAA